MKRLLPVFALIAAVLVALAAQIPAATRAERLTAAGDCRPWNQPPDPGNLFDPTPICTPPGAIYVPAANGPLQTPTVTRTPIPTATPTATATLGPPAQPSVLFLSTDIRSDGQAITHVQWTSPSNPDLSSVDIWRCDVAKGSCNPPDGEQIGSKTVVPGKPANINDMKPMPIGRSFCYTLFFWNTRGQSTRADAGCNVFYGLFG